MISFSPRKIFNVFLLHFCTFELKVIDNWEFARTLFFFGSVSFWNDFMDFTKVDKGLMAQELDSGDFILVCPNSEGFWSENISVGFVALNSDGLNSFASFLKLLTVDPGLFLWFWDMIALFLNPERLFLEKLVCLDIARCLSGFLWYSSKSLRISAFHLEIFILDFLCFEFKFVFLILSDEKLKSGVGLMNELVPLSFFMMSLPRDLSALVEVMSDASCSISLQVCNSLFLELASLKRLHSDTLSRWLNLNVLSAFLLTLSDSGRLKLATHSNWYLLITIGASRITNTFARNNRE